MADVKKRSQSDADLLKRAEKERLKLEKKEKKREAKQKKEEEKLEKKKSSPSYSSHSLDKKHRFTIFVSKEKEANFVLDSGQDLALSPESARKKKAGSKITSLLRRKDASSLSPPDDTPISSSPPSPARQPSSKQGTGVGAELVLAEKEKEKEKENNVPDKQNIRVRLTRFFTSRPSKQDLLEKKILQKDFQPPSEVTAVPLRHEGILLITNWMMKQAIYREGIFRIPGNALIVREIWKKLADPKLPVLAEETVPKEQGPNEFAGALKLYLREAPEPAVPFSLYNRFIEAITKATTLDQKVENIKDAISLLPEENYNIMKTLFVFLKNVSNIAYKNKMDVKNIGIVFGPSIVRKEIEENGFMELRSAALQAEIVCVILNNMLDIFGIEILELIQVGLDDPEAIRYMQQQQQQQQQQQAQAAAQQAAQQAAAQQQQPVPPSPSTLMPSQSVPLMPGVSPMKQRIIKIVRTPVLTNLPAPGTPAPSVSPRGTPAPSVSPRGTPAPSGSPRHISPRSPTTPRSASVSY